MGWWDRTFGKKETASTVTEDRYRGRPLLFLLDSYVMSVVGALPPAKEASVAGITAQVFGGDGDWKRTLRTTLGLGEEVDTNILGMWQRNQARAREACVVLTPEAFAVMVVDENFAHLIQGARS